MAFSTLRGFLCEEVNGLAQKRNDALLKSYESCFDKRAWSMDDRECSEYISQIVRRQDKRNDRPVRAVNVVRNEPLNLLNEQDSLQTQRNATKLIGQGCSEIGEKDDCSEKSQEAINADKLTDTLRDCQRNLAKRIKDYELLDDELSSYKSRNLELCSTLEQVCFLEEHLGEVKAQLEHANCAIFGYEAEIEQYIETINKTQEELLCRDQVLYMCRDRLNLMDHLEEEVERMKDLLKLNPHEEDITHRTLHLPTTNSIDDTNIPDKHQKTDSQAYNSVVDAPKFAKLETDNLNLQNEVERLSKLLAQCNTNQPVNKEKDRAVDNSPSSETAEYIKQLEVERNELKQQLKVAKEDVLLLKTSPQKETIETVMINKDAIKLEKSDEKVLRPSEANESDYNSQIKLLTTEKEQLNAEIQGLREQLKELKNANAQLTESMAKLKEVSKSNEKISQPSTADESDLNNQLKLLTTEKDQLNTEVEGLKGKLSDLESANSQLKQSLDEVKEVNKSNEKTSSPNTTDESDLNNQLKLLTTEKDQLNAEVEELKGKLNDLESANSQLKQSMDKVKEVYKSNERTSPPNTSADEVNKSNEKTSHPSTAVESDLNNQLKSPSNADEINLNDQIKLPQIENDRLNAEAQGLTAQLDKIESHSKHNAEEHTKSKQSLDELKEIHSSKTERLLTRVDGLRKSIDVHKINSKDPVRNSRKISAGDSATLQDASQLLQLCEKILKHGIGVLTIEELKYLHKQICNAGIQLEAGDKNTGIEFETFDALFQNYNYYKILDATIANIENEMDQIKELWSIITDVQAKEKQAALGAGETYRDTHRSKHRSDKIVVRLSGQPQRSPHSAGGIGYNRGETATARNRKTQNKQTELIYGMRKH